MLKRPFGDRVLHVRLRDGSENTIALAAHFAVEALRARDIQVVLDEVPLGDPPAPVSLPWTDDPALNEAINLWAGDDPTDPVAPLLAEAWSYTFGGAYGFASNYRLLAADLNHPN